MGWYIDMRKNIKIFIDIIMTILFVFLLIGLQIDIWWHIILSYALVSVVAIYIYLNRKWLFSSLKALRKNKAVPKTLYMQFLFIVLTIYFVVVTISDIKLTQISPVSDDIFTKICNYFDTQYNRILDLHIVSSVIFIISILLHVHVHWKYIKNKIREIY